MFRQRFKYTKETALDMICGKDAEVKALAENRWLVATNQPVTDKARGKTISSVSFVIIFYML